MADDTKRKQLSISIEVPENLKAGAHANIVSITSTGEGEVIFDFIFSHPKEKRGDQKIGRLVSRVVIPISVAKQLVPILIKHLEQPKPRIMEN